MFMPFYSENSCEEMAVEINRYVIKNLYNMNRQSEKLPHLTHLENQVKQM
jgi:hypothetical protein